MSNAKTLIYADNDDFLHKAIRFYVTFAPGIAIVAAVTIVGLIALPFMIPLWIVAFIYKKKKIAESTLNALKMLQVAGFTNSMDISEHRATIFIDKSSDSIAFWSKEPINFQPGLAKFSEISSVEYEKDGDVTKYIGENIAGQAINHTSRGTTHFSIKFNNIEQNTFKFKIVSIDAAKELMRKIDIIANLSN